MDYYPYEGLNPRKGFGVNSLPIYILASNEMRKAKHYFYLIKTIPID
jgi:hypothetical protein